MRRSLCTQTPCLLQKGHHCHDFKFGDMSHVFTHLLHIWDRMPHQRSGADLNVWVSTPMPVLRSADGTNETTCLFGHLALTSIKLACCRKLLFFFSFLHAVRSSVRQWYSKRHTFVLSSLTLICFVVAQLVSHHTVRPACHFGDFLAKQRLQGV